MSSLIKVEEADTERLQIMIKRKIIKNVQEYYESFCCAFLAFFLSSFLKVHSVLNEIIFQF